MQTGVDVAGGWQAFHADRTERLNAETDDAMRTHFENELTVARTTMQAMGIAVPTEEAVATDVDAHPQVSADVAPDHDATEGAPITAQTVPDSSGERSALAANLNPELAPFREDIIAASEATGVPANLLAAVIWDESKGVVSAGSTNGENGMTDFGLMQLNPATFADMKARHPDLIAGDAADASSNIMAGALYLKDMHDQFGDWDFALRAYNSGPLSVDLSDASISTTGFGTQNYVEKVNFYRETLEQGNVMPDGFPGGNQMY